LCEYSFDVLLRFLHGQDFMLLLSVLNDRVTFKVPLTSLRCLFAPSAAVHEATQQQAWRRHARSHTRGVLTEAWAGARQVSGVKPDPLVEDDESMLATITGTGPTETYATNRIKGRWGLLDSAPERKVHKLVVDAAAAKTAAEEAEKPTKRVKRNAAPAVSSDPVVAAAQTALAALPAIKSEVPVPLLPENSELQVRATARQTRAGGVLLARLLHECLRRRRQGIRRRARSATQLGLCCPNTNKKTHRRSHRASATRCSRKDAARGDGSRESKHPSPTTSCRAAVLGVGLGTKPGR